MCLLKGFISCEGLGTNNTLFSVNCKLSEGVGHALFILSLKARHPAQFLPYKEPSKYLWDWICIYSSTTQFTSSFLIYSFRDYTCWFGLQLELERKFISMNGEVSE